MLSNEARQGFFQVWFLSLFVSFITIIYSLSANNYVIRQDLMCIIPGPIYLPFSHKALWQSRQLKFFKNYD